MIPAWFAHFSFVEALRQVCHFVVHGFDADVFGHKNPFSRWLLHGWSFQKLLSLTGHPNSLSFLEGKLIKQEGAIRFEVMKRQKKDKNKKRKGL